MDLRSAYKATLEALQRIEQEQAEERTRLLNAAKVLEQREKELQTTVKQLEAEQRSVQEIKDVKAQKEANDAMARSLAGKESELKQLEIRLKKYENDLFGIKSRQDEKDQELRQRELHQQERERTYKEELEKNFTKNFTSKLLNS